MNKIIFSINYAKKTCKTIPAVPQNGIYKMQISTIVHNFIRYRVVLNSSVNFSPRLIRKWMKSSINFGKKSTCFTKALIVSLIQNNNYGFNNTIAAYHINKRRTAIVDLINRDVYLTGNNNNLVNLQYNYLFSHHLFAINHLNIKIFDPEYRIDEVFVTELSKKSKNNFDNFIKSINSLVHYCVFDNKNISIVLLPNSKLTDDLKETFSEFHDDLGFVIGICEH